MHRVIQGDMTRRERERSPITSEIAARGVSCPSEVHADTLILSFRKNRD